MICFEQPQKWLSNAVYNVALSTLKLPEWSWGEINLVHTCL